MAKSADGVILTVESFSIKKTLDGLLEGYPPPKIEQRIFARRLDEAKRLPLRMPVTLVEPLRVAEGRSSGLLRPWFCTAELVGHGDFGKWMASGLTVCFLEEQPFQIPASKLIETAAATIVWRDLAKGFDW